MKTSEIKKLTSGNKVIHKRYGLCTIHDVIWSPPGELFGVVIQPDTPTGKKLLARHSGVDIPNVLEDSVRMLKPAD